MSLDLDTLTAAGAAVAAMSSMLIFFAWLYDTSMRGLVWWAAGSLLNAVGIILIVVEHMDPNIGWAIVSGLCFSASAPSIWCAARLANNRPLRAFVAVAGPALGILGPALPGVPDVADFSLTIGLATTVAYTLASAYEFWRDRSERLLARGPMVGLLMFHAVIFTAGLIDSITSKMTVSKAPALGSLFGVVHFESLFFSLGTAIFIVAFARERSGLRHKIAARVDVLTDLASRRAFLERADLDLSECQERDAPLSLVIFDLDRFKSINDTHGHAIGDQVLQVFSDVSRKLLRTNDLVGRIGGEEFAMLMPGSSAGTAYVIADRIRIAFAEAGGSVAGRPVNATLSAGVATAHPHSTVDTLLEAADTALYRAKTLGRNRVETAERQTRADPGGSQVVIRIA